ncbi:Trimethyllysine dioxygenase [Microthyrium microscopicum]|uniref:Trimethyllysine dioxygenase n=1 Tax=Microthyrium microscopicum TaxID=703497 RepID=A0A6A6U173_9PEZI|nr:Trimethyllysine dioxygenase [Microthyrium microscopicum]
MAGLVVRSTRSRGSFRLTLKFTLCKPTLLFGNKMRLDHTARKFGTLSEPPRFHVLPNQNRPKQEAQPARVYNDKIQVFSDVSNRYVDIPNVWLRDHCHCAKCFHEVTKQRIIETFDEIPEDVRIVEGTLTEQADTISMQWQDGHSSTFDKQWLVACGLRNRPRSSERLAVTRTRLWDGKSIKANPPSVQYDDIINSDTGVLEWLLKIKEYGFSYVDKCPPTPEASEALLKRIAFIRNTHYGGFYDFTADLASGDTAYTQLGIGAHTDNTYFSDPAGLQMFHILSHTNGSGGASQLVDGFSAAAELYEQDRDAYNILATTTVYSHASGGDDMSIQPYRAFPVLLHDSQDGSLVQVRWNTTDRATIDTPMESMSQWYSAARQWANILRKQEYWEQLQPGRPLVFDNWRVLHGRSAFTGNRRVCGGYINRDDWISRFRILNKGRSAVLDEVLRA